MSGRNNFASLLISLPFHLYLSVPQADLIPASLVICQSDHTTHFSAKNSAVAPQVKVKAKVVTMICKILSREAHLDYPASSPSPYPAYPVPAVLASLLFLENTVHYSTSGPWHLLVPLPGMFFFQRSTGLILSTPSKYSFKCLFQAFLCSLFKFASFFSTLLIHSLFSLKNLSSSNILYHYFTWLFVLSISSQALGG